MTKRNLSLGVVINGYNPSTWEAEAEDLKFEASPYSKALSQNNK
jgi:hypothetical protein